MPHTWSDLFNQQ